MSTRKSNIRKRQRQKLRFANRPKPEATPIAPTSGLISKALEQLSPLAQAILDHERKQ